jgi:thiol-disulfide isomerase/thioredoxin
LTTAPSTGIGGVQRQQVSSLNYAGTATFSQPSSAPSSPPPLLRDLLSQTTTTVPSWAAAAAAKREENDLASVIREINTLEDYEKMLQDNTISAQQQQQAHKQHDAPPLIVVRFHATYCAACKRATPSFHRMVRKFVTSSSSSTSFPNKKNIQWVDVAVSKHNVDLQKHVGLKSIPSAFLYHAKAGLVEQLSINKNKLSHFEETLETYMEGQCPVNYSAEGECL